MLIQYNEDDQRTELLCTLSTVVEVTHNISDKPTYNEIVLLWLLQFICNFEEAFKWKLIERLSNDRILDFKYPIGTKKYGEAFRADLATFIYNETFEALHDKSLNLKARIFGYFEKSKNNLLW